LVSVARSSIEACNPRRAQLSAQECLEIWRCGPEALSDNFNHRGNKVAADAELRRGPRDDEKPPSLKAEELRHLAGSSREIILKTTSNY
jgi:hypothetical protein